VTLNIAPGDSVACILVVNGLGVGPFVTVGPVASQDLETIPPSEAVSLQAGQAPEVACSGYTANSGTSFYDGGMTSVLINSTTGSPAAGAKLPRLGLPAPIVHGSAASPIRTVSVCPGTNPAARRPAARPAGWSCARTGHPTASPRAAK
jgi:hypothetical protein